GAEAFAVFAHLAPGTVSLATGQEVRVGDLIGRVGHTGNSTAPHLHFQLMDASDPLRAKGCRAPSRSTWSCAVDVGSGSSVASLAEANGSAPCPTRLPEARPPTHWVPRGGPVTAGMVAVAGSPAWPRSGRR